VASRNHRSGPPDQSDPELSASISESELAAIAAGAGRTKDGTAYMEQQATRPHSPGFGLDDSPLGLAGRILEKFHAWCDIRDGMPITNRSTHRQPANSSALERPHSASGSSNPLLNVF
jgi:hypothetical protein